LLDGGSDWQNVRTDGCVTLDVRLVLKTADNALIGMTYRDLRQGSPSRPGRWVKNAGTPRTVRSKSQTGVLLKSTTHKLSPFDRQTSSIDGGLPCPNDSSSTIARYASAPFAEERARYCSTANREEFPVRRGCASLMTYWRSDPGLIEFPKAL
jgi:hypothetical protein